MGIVLFALVVFHILMQCNHFVTATLISNLYVWSICDFLSFLYCFDWLIWPFHSLCVIIKRIKLQYWHSRNNRFLCNLEYISEIISLSVPYLSKCHQHLNLITKWIWNEHFVSKNSKYSNFVFFKCICIEKGAKVEQCILLQNTN